MTTANAPRNFGSLLRDWRNRRSMSQLALAAEAEISQRHLSFMESGRSTPSRNMVLHIAEQLGVPLRERNAMLAAAGFAPVFPERRLDDPEFAAARTAIEAVLARHEPFPALAFDRHWNLVHANAGITTMLAGVGPDLLAPPTNVLRLTLHPDGLAKRIVNYREWRAHVLHRLGEQVTQTGDSDLLALRNELKAYPVPPGAAPYRAGTTTMTSALAVPFRLFTPDGVLSFISTTTVFGTALDVTLSEIAIEAFFPADDETRDQLFASNKQR